MFRALLGLVEGHRHVEDRPVALLRHHPAGGEGAAIADPLHPVDDRLADIAGAQEVGLQGMRRARRHGARRGRQGLADDLSAEDAGPDDVAAFALEAVLVQGRQVEQGEQIGQVGVHGVSLLWEL